MKKITACVFCFLLFDLGLTMKLKNSDGPVWLWMNRATVIVMGLAVIDLYTEYSGFYR